MSDPDVIVIGSGPNGLTAAAVLARAGRRVVVLERADRIGGGASTRPLTVDGFRHDVCSAVHPLAAASPAFADLQLGDHGLELLEPEIQLAHPLGGDRAAALHRSVARTAETLGRDGDRYRRWVEPVADHFDELLEDILQPLMTSLPRHPLVLARFGMRAGLPSAALARVGFRAEAARALQAGLAGHSGTPLHGPATTVFALILAAAGHRVGWPVPRGGAQALADALASVVRSHGGEIRTSSPVSSLAELPSRAVVMADLAPGALADLAGQELPDRYRRRLRRYRAGPGVFKVDYALSGPVPWSAPACRRSVTVHVGGPYREIAASERAVEAGRVVSQPFVLVAQPSVVDPSRAPAGQHTLWAYCHVPNGYGAALGDLIDAQIERFAPGFRQLIIARAERGPAQLEAANPNLVGGDVNGGRNDLRQLLARPTWRLDPYSTPSPRLFICSASTPPGGGVHGMCGYGAADSVLRRT